MIDAATALADLKDALCRNGEQVTFRRYAADRTKKDTATPVNARVMGYTAAELIGNVQQGDRRVIVSADPDNFAPITFPLLKGDKAVIRGIEVNIEEVDDNSRRIGGVLVGYELRVRGRGQ